MSPVATTVLLSFARRHSISISIIMSSKYATLDEESGGALPSQEEHHEDILDNDDDDVQSVSILSRRSRVVDEESLHEPLTSSPQEDVDDPFHVFREDLYRKLDLVEEGLTEYLRIIHQTVEC